MAKKISFNEMLNTKEPVAAEPVVQVKEVKPVTAEQHKERILKVFNKQLSEGGSQETVFKTVFPEESDKQEFIQDVTGFVNSLSDEEVAKTRVFVSNDDVCRYHMHAVRSGAKLITPKYVLVLEKDQNKDDGSYVLRIIMNKQELDLKILGFFDTLDFQNMSLKVVKDLMKHMDDTLGINVRQMLMDDFQNVYGGRKNWFQFSDGCYGIYEKGDLILTHIRWKRSVSLRMPENGDRPWLYHAEKADDGTRKSATFRVNLYGALWHSPKWST